MKVLVTLTIEVTVDDTNLLDDDCEFDEIEFEKRLSVELDNLLGDTNRKQHVTELFEMSEDTAQALADFEIRCK